MKRLLPSIDVQPWSTDYDQGIYVETLYEGWSLAFRWLGITIEINFGRGR
ncbi:MAG: hypothetical protein M3Q08_01065 [Pseudomonadota bacterium]|nr:hypothetical protein [Pseudomonadota bacterium]